MKVWSSYSVHAWPTLMFLDPLGRVIGKIEGEFLFEDLDRAIGEMVAEFDRKGLLERGQKRFLRESLEPGLLRYPGKIAADEATGRLYISDTGHNRILVASSDGKVIARIGNGEMGLLNGPAESARFYYPQGLTIAEGPAGRALYVADSNNHAIRQISLVEGEGFGQVTTAAGTGTQALGSSRAGVASDTSLSSPWDLVTFGAEIYIAMAGLHQLWILDLKADRVLPFAGSGREALLDGPIARANFAQPSGLTVGGDILYVADSETSSIRAVNLAGDGPAAKTLVGEGLFDFGDVDGQGSGVRLQHPLGVLYEPGSGLVYIADSYNNKIKTLDPKTRRVTSYLGDGAHGLIDGKGKVARLNEPSGMVLLGGRLYITDANNHRVRVCDLSSGELTTLDLRE